MTQAVGAHLPAISTSREHGRIHKDALSEEGAFGKVLQEGAPQASVTEGVPPPNIEERRGWGLASHLSKSAFEPEQDQPTEDGGPPRDEQDASEAPVLPDGAPDPEDVGRALPSLIEGRGERQPPPSGNAWRALPSPPVQANMREAKTVEAGLEQASAEEAPKGLRADMAITKGQNGEAQAAVDAGLTANLKGELSPVPQNARASRFSAKDNEDANEQASYGASSGVDQKQTPVRVISAQTTPAPAAILPGISNTGAILASSLAEDPGFASTAAQAARAVAEARPASREPLNTLRLQLQPADLGMVTARLTISDNQLTVELQVETPEARRRLQADGDAMREALRTLGYDVDRITVQQAPNSASFTSASSTSARDPGFQASAGQGQPGGDSQPNARQGNGHGGAPSREVVEGRQNDASGSGLYI